MGSGGSTLSYPEAARQFSDDESLRLMTNFKRLLPTPTAGETEFVQNMSHQIKPELRRRIFRLFTGRSNESVTMERFIIVAARAIKLGRESQTKLCAEVFEDAHRAGRVTRASLLDTLKAIADSALLALDADVLGLNASNTLQAASDATRREETLQKIVTHAMVAGKSATADSLALPELRAWLSINPHLAQFVAWAVHRECDAHTASVPELLLLKQLPAPPKLLGGASEILNSDTALQLKQALVSPWSRCDFVLLYSSQRDGFSLDALVQRFTAKPREIELEPSLLLVKDFQNRVMGGFGGEPWRRYFSTFYGNDKTFIFTLAPKFEIWRPTGRNACFQLTTEHGIGFGGQLDAPAIWLDESFKSLKTYYTDTFRNMPLLGEGNGNESRVAVVELWGLISPERLEEHRRREAAVELDDDGKPKKHTVLDDKAGMFMLELLGKNFSQNLE